MNEELRTKALQRCTPITNPSKLFLRPHEVRPVAAWVLPETPETLLNPEISAVEEERKLGELRICKEVKLKHFQEQVKRRLALAIKSNRENQLQEFHKDAIEKHKIIFKGYYQNSAASDYAEDCSDMPLMQKHFVMNKDRNNSDFIDVTRRAFMDAEREQVRELRRKQQIKKRLDKERKMKEVDDIFKISNMRISRAESEQDNLDLHAINGLDHKKHCLNSEVPFQYSKNVICEVTHSKLTCIEDESQPRLIEILKNNLASKFSMSGQPLPRLCFCCTNVLQNNPKTCASNCVYSNNPNGNATITNDSRQCVISQYKIDDT